MALPGKRTTYNKTMTLADTEYSQKLPEGTKKFLVKCRGDFDIKLSTVEDESGSNYITIPAGQSYWEDDVSINLTLFFQCSNPDQVVEIISWQ